MIVLGMKRLVNGTKIGLGFKAIRLITGARARVSRFASNALSVRVLDSSIGSEYKSSVSAYYAQKFTPNFNNYRTFRIFVPYYDTKSDCSFTEFATTKSDNIEYQFSQSLLTKVKEDCRTAIRNLYDDHEISQVSLKRHYRDIKVYSECLEKLLRHTSVIAPKFRASDCGYFKISQCFSDINLEKLRQIDKDLYEVLIYIRDKYSKFLLSYPAISLNSVNTISFTYVNFSPWSCSVYLDYGVSVTYSMKETKITEVSEENRYFAAFKENNKSAQRDDPSTKIDADDQIRVSRQVIDIHSIKDLS